jgi:hypothetical protein
MRRLFVLLRWSEARKHSCRCPYTVEVGIVARAAPSATSSMAEALIVRGRNFKPKRYRGPIIKQADIKGN